MARIGRFFKRVGRGIRTGFNKFMNAAPKAIDVGRKLLNNETIKQISGTIADKYGVRDKLEKGREFASKALDKTQQISDAYKNNGVKGIANMIKV